MRIVNNMLIIDCFGHNIFVDNQLIGYIQENELVISGKKFADISDDGVITFNQKEIGYVDDDGTIMIKDREAGYINGSNDFVFYKNFANLAK